MGKFEQLDFAKRVTIQTYLDEGKSASFIARSAKHHQGFERLLKCIAENLPETAKRMKLLIPYDKTSLIGKIRLEGKIFSEEYIENGTLIDALVDKKLISQTEQYKIKADTP